MASAALIFSLLTFLSANSHAVDFPAQGRDAAKLHLPKQYESKKEWPLILLLHGYSGNGQFVEGMFHLKERTSTRGFMLLVPNGRVNREGKRFWNATDYCCDFEKTGTDDVEYLTGLIRKVQSEYSVDAKRIYVVGHSNGGFMANRLLCETDGLFAASADLAGAAFKDPARCNSKTPVSALHVHALDDKTIKYDGDVGYPSAQETVQRLVDRNACQRFEQASSPADLIRSIKGSDTIIQKWSSCEENTEVQLWTIKAYDSFLHIGHVPWLSGEFSEKLIDFLFSHKI